MGNNRIIKKSWRKIANEKISKEMSFGWNYVKDQMDMKNRQMDLKWLKRKVRDWTMSDVERVDVLLRHRKECDPEQFSRQFNQVIYPLMGNCGKIKDIDKICDLMSKVVGERICEESSKYGLWN